MTPRDPRKVLREAGLRPKRSFGQNFLVAEPIARAIAEACVQAEEQGRARVLELGAGTGVLTRWLVGRARELTAVERDRDLVPVLIRELLGTDARVIEADAQSIDIARLLGNAEPGSPRVLCGNLPYAITGSLIRRAVENANAVDRVVFMVQEEVAHRMVARPGAEDRGALTVFVQAAFDVRRVLRAPPGAFHPSPAVSSAVVEMIPLRSRRAVETETFRALVHRAFQARRKTLRNAWAPLVADRAVLERAAALAEVALDARGETLEVTAFAAMAAAIDRVSAPQ
ncbi:MAG: 16S rRNA (adenine(1518)-N(6)/adenine(1519)-N(6))-dimethyltransferase RsmA [Polyangiaceae bacterium]|jgi:16S rRNA (adenine1518-N6/adenine1519-N6)-dimethyltransferase